jgi:hypothetical protein
LKLFIGFNIIQQWKEVTLELNEPQYIKVTHTSILLPLGIGGTCANRGSSEALTVPSAKKFNTAALLFCSDLFPYELL